MKQTDRVSHSLRGLHTNGIGLPFLRRVQPSESATAKGQRKWTQRRESESETKTKCEEIVRNFTDTRSGAHGTPRAPYSHMHLVVNNQESGIRSANQDTNQEERRAVIKALAALGRVLRPGFNVARFVRECEETQ